MGKKLDLLKKIVEFFREDHDGILQTLRQGVAMKDFRGIEHAAHNLRGLIANFNAEAASQAALRLEHMARNRELTDAPAALKEFELELERLDAALSSELPKLEIAGNQ